MAHSIFVANLSPGTTALVLGHAFEASGGVLFEGRMLRVSVASFQEPHAGRGTPDGADHARIMS